MKPSFPDWTVPVLVTLIFASIVGCGGPSQFPLAEVSGRVTFDGQPVANVMVTFMPISDGKNPNSGPYSLGLTDANGVYHLQTRYGEDGAVVGTHRIVLETAGSDPELAAVEGNPESSGGSERLNDQASPTSLSVPKKWGPESIMEMTVPEGGTKTADIELSQ